MKESASTKDSHLSPFWVIIKILLKVFFLIIFSVCLSGMNCILSALPYLLLFNPLNPGQFTRRVYRLLGAIRDNVPVSVSVSFFWQRKFR